MNRQERRRKEAMDRSSKFTKEYVHNLPEVGADILDKPGFSHIVFYHDDWCELYSGKGPSCNCNPEVRHFAEPKRS